MIHFMRQSFTDKAVLLRTERMSTRSMQLLSQQPSDVGLLAPESPTRSDAKQQGNDTLRKTINALRARHVNLISDLLTLREGLAWKLNLFKNSAVEMHDLRIARQELTSLIAEYDAMGQQSFSNAAKQRFIDIDAAFRIAIQAFKRAPSAPTNELFEWIQRAHAAIEESEALIANTRVAQVADVTKPTAVALDTLVKKTDLQRSLLEQVLFNVSEYEDLRSKLHSAEIILNAGQTDVIEDMYIKQLDVFIQNKSDTDSALSQLAKEVDNTFAANASKAVKQTRDPRGALVIIRELCVRNKTRIAVEGEAFGA